MAATLTLLLLAVGAADSAEAAFANFDRFCLQQPRLFPTAAATAKAAGWATPPQELELAPEVRDKLFYPAGSREQMLVLNVHFKELRSENRGCVLALHQGDFDELRARLVARLGAPGLDRPERRYAFWSVPGTLRMITLRPDIFMKPGMALAAIDLIPSETK